MAPHITLVDAYIMEVLIWASITIAFRTDMLMLNGQGTDPTERMNSPSKNIIILISQDKYKTNTKTLYIDELIYSIYNNINIFYM